jgi:hydrophobic/amphiphilic exporter-1 (mainly G- bacteria), HAE1 family
MGLTKTAIARPVFVLMLMLGAVLIGFISYNSMRKELNPEVNFGTITVVTAYPGAGPEEINNLISRKVESAVSGVNGIREVTSTSREGLSIVSIAFELETNMDSALSDVRSKVDGVTNAIPKDALKPTVSKNDFSAQPVLNLGVSSSTLSSRDLRDLIDKQLIDKFGQIQGVSAADVQGGEKREIQVQVKRDKLIAYGLGINDIQRAISLAAGNTPVGKIVTASQEFAVRIPADFTTPEQIQGLVFTVSDNKGGNNGGNTTRTVRLADVATIKDAVQERSQYSRLNGKDNITIAISKAREGNAVQITAAADKVIADIQKEYKDQGITFVKTLESAKQITESLTDLQTSLMFGIFLVSLIVFIFLHNFRGMLIVILAIPTCIFASFVAMKAFGFTINNMSMLALSLAIGVLVDDAIVVIENIYRHLKMGEDPRDAAINGRSEIGVAAIAITLADVVVFLPIAFMGGIVGQFFKPLALGFVMATVFSLLVSFTLTPMLASRWYRRGEDLENPTGRFAKWFERMFGRVEKGYRNGLEWALNHRWFVFIMGNAILFAVFMFIAGSFAPKVGDVFFSKAPGGPPMPGPAMMLLALSIVLGIAVFGFQFLRAAFGDIARKRLYLGLAGVIFVGGVAMGLKPLMVLPLAFLLPLILVGIVGFIANLGMRKVKSRLIVNAALFGLLFPVAAVGGFYFAQWKKDMVFKFSFLPNSDQGSIGIKIQLPQGSSLARTQQVVSQIENVVMKDPMVKYVSAQVGSQSGGWGGGGTTGSNYAQITATLYEKAALIDKMRKSDETLRWVSSSFVSARLLQHIGHIPGATIFVDSGQGGGFGAPIQLGLGSNDHKLLVSTAKKIKEGLLAGKIKGIINPDISVKEGKPEVNLEPDRQRMADANVSNADMASALRTLYNGNDDAKLRLHGEEYPIRVMLDLQDRNDPTVLASVPVVFKQGKPILVRDLTGEPKIVPAADKIDRRNRLEEVQVTANLLPGFTPGSVQQEVDKWIKDDHMIPDAVQLRPLGQADAMQREGQGMMSAFFLGLLLVYMVLASLYDNLLYPFIIQLAQPQAFTGALLALVLTDTQFDLVGFIGLVCLVGLVGKNAILVVDYANTLRHRGRTRHDALVEAGPTRLRPIMMTTLALILGMMPVALALGRGSEFRQSIGIIIIGGITLSTLLTLFVIPCSYTIFDDISIAIGGLFGKKADQQPAPPSEEPPVAPTDPLPYPETVRGGE